MTAKPQNVEQYHRFCPGEERIKISDAVCLGRRRGNFPKCKNCQFNDDLNRAGSTGSHPADDRSVIEIERARRESVEDLFRAHDIRGLSPEPLDSDVAWCVGLATAQFLRSELRGYDRSLPEKATVVVGADMRKTSADLTAALIDGIRAGGAPVVDIGMIDAGQLYFAVNRLTSCGGVHVTGAHCSADVNGFRIVGSKGRPLRIETGLGKICKIAKNTTRHISAQVAGLRTEDLSDQYKGFVRGFLRQPTGDINEEKPLRLVVDASNGMAGRWLPILFEDVPWLEIVRLNFEHNGQFVHDPDPRDHANLEQLSDRVIRSKGDLGVCFDGDAGRLVLVDNQGRPVRPDLTGLLIARLLLKATPGSTIIHDILCSRVVPEEIRKAGGIPRRERRLLVRKAVIDGLALAAIESTGRYDFHDNAHCPSAIIALVQVLNILTETGSKLDELITPLNRYARSGPRTYTADAPDVVINRLAEQFGNASIDYLDGITVQYDDWWFNLRPSDDPHAFCLNLEANDDAALQVRLAEVGRVIGQPTDT